MQNAASKAVLYWKPGRYGRLEFSSDSPYGNQTEKAIVFVCKLGDIVSMPGSNREKVFLRKDVMGEIEIEDEKWDAMVVDRMGNPQQQAVYWKEETTAAEVIIRVKKWVEETGVLLESNDSWEQEDTGESPSASRSNTTVNPTSTGTSSKQPQQPVQAAPPLAKYEPKLMDVTTFRSLVNLWVSEHTQLGQAPLVSGVLAALPPTDRGTVLRKLGDKCTIDGVLEWLECRSSGEGDARAFAIMRGFFDYKRDPSSSIHSFLAGAEQQLRDLRSVLPQTLVKRTGEETEEKLPREKTHDGEWVPRGWRLSPQPLPEKIVVWWALNALSAEAQDAQNIRTLMGLGGYRWGQLRKALGEYFGEENVNNNLSEPLTKQESALVSQGRTNKMIELALKAFKGGKGRGGNSNSHNQNEKNKSDKLCRYGARCNNKKCGFRHPNRDGNGATPGEGKGGGGEGKKGKQD